MSTEAITISAYVGLGFFYISASHSYYAKYFHQGEKRFGKPFNEESGIRINHKYGYVGAVFVGLISFSLLLNFFTYSFTDFPNPQMEFSIRWVGGLLLIFIFMLLVVSPLLGGPAATKWVLEGCLFFLTFLLIGSYILTVFLLNHVQWLFSVFAGTLIAVYLAWLRIYILRDKNIKANSLADVLDGFDKDNAGTWAIWGTVVYFVFSSVYLVFGYLICLIILNPN